MFMLLNGFGTEEVVVVAAVIAVVVVRTDAYLCVDVDDNGAAVTPTLVACRTTCGANCLVA